MIPPIGITLDSELCGVYGDVDAFMQYVEDGSAASDWDILHRLVIKCLLSDEIRGSVVANFEIECSEVQYSWGVFLRANPGLDIETEFRQWVCFGDWRREKGLLPVRFPVWRTAVYGRPFPDSEQPEA